MLLVYLSNDGDDSKTFLGVESFDVSCNGFASACALDAATTNGIRMSSFHVSDIKISTILVVIIESNEQFQALFRKCPSHDVRQ